MALSILYLPHDVSDPAVAKRVAMLQDGGAVIALAGFRRSAAPVPNTIDFGQTFNGNFAQRMISILRLLMTLRRHRALFEQADLILARNLEMLAIGVRGRSLCKKKPVLVYESLDIHRLLLKPGVVGKLLRHLEGWLSRRASCLITSSPAFVREYFEVMSQVRLPIRLVENKIYPPQHQNSASRTNSPPWKIGWFGAIRCRKSLKLLSDLARNSNGTVEVIIRGRPSLDQFKDFHHSTSNVPGLSCRGPYKNPDDLTAIYGEVHFTWAIDMFEEGLNSSWLLPNRLYEGGVYGSVPIAVAGVETGRFLEQLNIGVLLSEPKDKALADFFSRLTPERYRGLPEKAASIPMANWMYSKEDCQELVSYLSSLKHD